MLTPTEAHFYLSFNKMDQILDMNDEGTVAKWFFNDQGVLCLERDRNSTIQAFEGFTRDLGVAPTGVSEITKEVE